MMDFKCVAIFSIDFCWSNDRSMCLGTFTFVHMTFSGTEILSEVTAMDKDDPTKSNSLQI